MRSLIGICTMVGMTAGGYVPVVWGASAFSPSSLLLSVVGGVAGIWFGVRLAEY